MLRYGPWLVVLLGVVGDTGQFADPDLWGHLRFGQAVLASGRVVVRDSYTYSVMGGVWRNHEWLTEVVMALAYGGLGVVGLKLWKFLSVLGTLVLMAEGLGETGASAGIQLNTLGLAALAMVPQNQFRPQLFTFLFLAGTLALLGRENYRGERGRLWLMVPLMGLWGNLHGGFIIGIGVLGAYTAVAGLEDVVLGRGPGRGLLLGAVTLAGTLATLVSPYGIDAWVVVLNALRHYAAQPIIADWQPLLSAIALGWRIKPADTLFFICGVIMIATFAIVVIRTPRGGDLPLVVVAAMLSVAAFTAVRNLPLAMIACAAPLARHAELIVARRRERISAANGSGVAEKPPKVERTSVKSWIAISIAGMLAIFGGLFSNHIPVGPDSPVAAVAFMRGHGLSGNILSNFASGEYLIWHLVPPSKVFIDGRYDTVYPQKITDDYLAFINALPGGARVLDAYPHDFVLIPHDGPAAAIMKHADRWKLIYRDPNWVLFARADSAAAKLPGVPIAATPPAMSYFP